MKPIFRPVPAEVKPDDEFPTRRLGAVQQPWSGRNEVTDEDVVTVTGCVG